MDVSSLLNIVDFMLVAVAFVYIYKILRKTAEEFYKSIFYILTSVLVLGAAMFLRVLTALDVVHTDLSIRILEMWFLVVLIVGFLHLNNCIKEICRKAFVERKLIPKPKRGKLALPENNVIIYFAMVTAVVSVSVIFGWFFDITPLKSIMPGWVSMKFITALAFLAASAMLFFLMRAIYDGTEMKRIINPNLAVLILSAAMLIIIGIVFIFSLFGIDTGIQNIVATEEENAGIPGIPSIAAMFNFELIALAGIVSFFN